MIRILFCASLMLLPAIGCDSNETVLPTTPFTQEQIEKIQAEDRSIENEESQGSASKPKKKK
jgi:hypothetical protein